MKLQELQRNANINIMYKEMYPETKTDNRPFIFLSTGKMVRSYRFTGRNNYISISTYDMASLPIETLEEILEGLNND